MTAILGDETALLLAIQVSDDDAEHKQTALDNVSEAVITRLALRAKAEAYQLRIDRWLANAANLGADLDELAAAAGMSRSEALRRVESAPPGLLTEAVRRRLALEATLPEKRRGAASPQTADEITQEVDTTTAVPAPGQRRRFGWRGRAGRATA